MKKLTNDLVIMQLKNLYGDSLDYSKVLYKNSRSYITLICPIHGEFELYANNALLGRGGCPKCKLGISNQEEFLKAAIEHFGDKFTYEKTIFKDLSTKIIVTCPIHGDFLVVPRHFLTSKYGCVDCYNDSRRKTDVPQLSEEEKRKLKELLWITKCTEIHNGKYDYSKVYYTKCSEKVEIICPEHGSFLLIAKDHKDGKGCPKCAIIQRTAKTKLTLLEFELKANEKWNNKYTYGLYHSMHEYIEVTCPIHGVFLVTPHNHLVDSGCPSCSKSYGETFILQFLELNRIDYISQYKIPIDKNINSSGIAKIDFYLPLYDAFIEYNGILHYVPVNHFGGELKFNLLILRDNYIRDYCDKNLIILVEIPYTFTTKEIVDKLEQLISFNI